MARSKKKEKAVEPKKDRPYPTTTSSDTVATVKVDAPPVAEKKPVLEPLGPGQKYFEAPDGKILIGDADRDRMWYRDGNCWINPKR